MYVSISHILAHRADKTLSDPVAGNQLSPRLRLASFYVTLIDTLGAVAIVHSFDIWESRSAQYVPFLVFGM